MKVIKTIDYKINETELRQLIVDWFNAKKISLPVTKANVVIDFDKQPYCEPTAYAVITVEEESEI